MPSTTPSTTTVENITGEQVVFGVDVNRTIGIVQSENDNNSAEVAEIRDETGKVVLQKAYSKSRERSFEALFLSGTTPPKAGDVVTIGVGEAQWKGLVKSANKTKSNTEFCKISITAEQKDAATLVPYA